MASHHHVSKILNWLITQLIHYAPKTLPYLLVPKISTIILGGRASGYQALLLRNKLPVRVRGADTVSVFKIRFLYDEAYS